MAKNKKMIFVSGFFFVALAALVVVTLFLFPFELREFSQRVELWRAGVSSRVIQGWHTYEVNRCGSQNGEGCSCIALVHGLGDQALTWKKILLFSDENWKKLGLVHGYKILAVDLPGSGKTPIPSDLTEYRVRKEAEKLRTVLASQCAQWVVVGNSMGGWVASWLALDWPEGVKRLILSASAGLKKFHQNEKVLLLSEPTVDGLKEFQKKAYFRPRPIPEWQWKIIVKKAKEGPSAQIVRAQVEEDFLDSRLPALRVPTLLIWGKEDHVVPLEQGYHLRSLIRGVFWREILECGHLPQKECPLPLIKGVIDMIHLGPY
jgi:pimeloyl-ACP methyl ester carboxylesterase